MKKLAIAMTMSALTILALPCAAEIKAQKRIAVTKVAQSKVSQSLFSNKNNKLGEKEIYNKILSDAKRSGFKLKEIEAKKLSHIVNSALENTPPEAASINIKVTIHFKKPVKLEIEVSF